MSVDIDQLRRDLRLTAEREGWSEAEVMEVGTAIRAEIEAGNAEALEAWAEQLSWWRRLLASYAQRLRAFEAEVRAKRDQRRAS